VEQARQEQLRNGVFQGVAKIMVNEPLRFSLCHFGTVNGYFANGARRDGRSAAAAS